MNQQLERHYLKQYARAWRLLKLHAHDRIDGLNEAGCNLLLDVANLRQRDIETLRADARRLEEVKQR